MVSKGLRERAKQLSFRSPKEKKDPAGALSRQCGPVATMASVKKSTKSSAASKNEGIKFRPTLAGQEKNLPSKKCQPQNVPVLSPSHPAHSLPKAMHGEEEGKKKERRLPLVVPKCLVESKQSKVAFQATGDEDWSKRRLSVPDESCHSPLKSILKKRNSICTDSSLHGMQSTLQHFSTLWDIPWERDGRFPPIAPKGLLLFHDEGTVLPPVRRNSLQANYSYSQEFTQALFDLKNRSPTQEGAPVCDAADHEKNTPELQTDEHRPLSLETHDRALPELVQIRSATRRFSE